MPEFQGDVEPAVTYLRLNSRTKENLQEAKSGEKGNTIICLWLDISIDATRQ